MKKKLVILGSTGSIGRSALEVVAKNSDRIEILGLSAHANVELLLEQAAKFNPRFMAVTDSAAFEKLKEKNFPGTILLGYSEGLSTLTAHPEADIVLNAIVGAAGLKASLDTLRAGKRLALANKESMVVGGELINQERRKSSGELIPVDSEHSAIWQALFSGRHGDVRKIILTGSGGPFRETPLKKFASITKTEALRHPTWKMGPKITIDSATMMNKGLEIIEAVQLFGVAPEKIEVVIHPQSIIHSMVEFVDSSVIAQLSRPDMRLPIAYALFYPERVYSLDAQINLAEQGQLTFAQPDFHKFPLLKAAYEVAREGGTVPAVFNAANEVAVGAFLKEAINFGSIPDIVIKCVEKHIKVDNPSYEDIVRADQWGRQMARELAG